MSGTDPKYTDQEVQAIIKNALVLQRKNVLAMQRESQEGLTISDIESIGSDVGISPEHIRQAVVDLATETKKGLADKFLGGSANPEVKTVLPIAVEERELKRALMMMPSVTGDEGAGDAFGSSLRWTTSAVTTEKTGRRTDIMIDSSETHTSIQATDNLGQMAWGVFGGIIGGLGLGAGLGVGFGVGIGALGSALFSGIFPIGALVASYFFSRFIFSTVSKARKHRLEKIVDKLKQGLAKQTDGEG